MKIIEKEVYLKRSYSDLLNPKSDYPTLLAEWICKNIFKHIGSLADFGCGVGDFLEAFENNGYDVCGYDISPFRKTGQRDFQINKIDFESASSVEKKYDFLFSKSVLEHIKDVENFMALCFNALSEGGKVVIMVPSWEYNYKRSFYVDHTHVSPFTKISLRELMIMSGFKNVSVSYFYQLPFLWNRNYLKIFVRMFGLLPLPFFPFDDVVWKNNGNFNKLIRFSKEVMLLGVGEK